MQFICAEGLKYFYEDIKLIFRGSVYLCLWAEQWDGFSLNF